MTEARPFKPSWISPPGDTLGDLLEARGWSQTEFAERTGFTRKHINDLIKGRAAITADTASRLSRVLGSTVEFWLTREANYRAALERQSTLDGLKAHIAWLSSLPVAWMIKQGWLKGAATKAETVDACLRFFGVASVEAWQHCYANPLTAYRAAHTAERRPGAVAAWLRRAELEADALRCAPYDERAFRALLPSLRALTREPDPKRFVPRVQALCASVGVAVVFVPTPPNCPVSGATRWLSPYKALLVLSLRYKSDDQLWFSFFHEVGHLLLHGKKLIFIEGCDGLDEDQEAEADRFARDLLIPAAAARRLPSLCTAEAIEAEARALDIAPGIVLGRMQREGLHPWRTFLARLKVHYAWEDVPSPAASTPQRSAR